MHKVYLEAFTKSAQNTKPTDLQKAHRAGQQAARHGVALLSKEELKNKRNYGDDEADAYIESYQRSAPIPEEQALIKVRRKAQNAANAGRKSLSVAELKSRGYNDQQITAYSEAYNCSAGDATVQKLRKIRRMARQAAWRKAKLNQRTFLSLEKIQYHYGYTDAQAQVYIQAFQDGMANKLHSALDVHPTSEEIITGIEHAVTDNGEDKTVETEQNISQPIINCENNDVNADPYHYLEQLLNNPNDELIDLKEEEGGYILPEPNSIVLTENPLEYLEKLMDEAEAIQNDSIVLQQPATYICNPINKQSSPKENPNLLYIESLIFADEQNVMISIKP